MARAISRGLRGARLRPGPRASGVHRRPASARLGRRGRRARLGGPLARVSPGCARRAIGSGRRGSCRRDAVPVVIPAARSAPARMQRPTCASSWSGSSLQVCSTSAAAPAFAIAAALLGFSPVIAVDAIRPPSTQRCATPTRTAPLSTSVCSTLTTDEPQRLTSQWQTSRLRSSKACWLVLIRALSSPRVSSSATSPSSGATADASGAFAVAGPPTCSSARSRVSADMATFDVRFLGCKVSHLDAQDVRERLLADGHVERAGDAEVAIVNTCCVTNEALSKSRQVAARAARTHRRVYVTGCGANLGGETSARPAAERRVVVRRRSEETTTVAPTSALSAASRTTLGSSASARS